MRKFDKELEAINKQIEDEKTKRANIEDNKSEMLTKALADLATIEGQEAFYLEEKSEAAFDDLMMKKAALKEKIKILEARQTIKPSLPGDKETVKNIFLRTGVLDKESEDWARKEIQEHLQEIDAILNIRNDERQRLEEAKNKALYVYNVPSVDGATAAINRQTDCLRLREDLKKSQGFTRLLTGSQLETRYY